MHGVHPSFLLALVLTTGCTVGGATWDPADRTAYLERCTARFVSASTLEPQELDGVCSCTADKLQGQYPSYAKYSASPSTDTQEKELFAGCGYDW